MAGSVRAYRYRNANNDTSNVARVGFCFFVFFFFASALSLSFTLVLFSVYSPPFSECNEAAAWGQCLSSGPAQYRECVKIAVRCASSSLTVAGFRFFFRLHCSTVALLLKIAPATAFWPFGRSLPLSQKKKKKICQ